MVTSNTETSEPVDSTDPNVYLATRFTLINVDSIKILFPTLKDGTTIYLQVSNDGINWNAHSNKNNNDLSDNIITFSNLNVLTETYFRIVLVNASPTTSNGWLGEIKTITFYGYPKQ